MYIFFGELFIHIFFPLFIGLSLLSCKNILLHIIDTRFLQTYEAKKSFKPETQTTEQIKNFWPQMAKNFEAEHEIDTWSMNLAAPSEVNPKLAMKNSKANSIPRICIISVRLSIGTTRD